MAKVKRKAPETSGTTSTGATAINSSAGATSGHTCPVCEDLSLHYSRSKRSKQRARRGLL